MNDVPHSRGVHFLLVVFAALLPTCGESSEPDRCDLEVSEDAYPGCESDVVGLSAEQKLRADRLVSVFENDTIEIRYDYIQNLHDGRGYTAGRSGFTTANGDLLDVVDRYTDAVGDNPLAVFLPRLRELADEESESVDGLEDLPEAWKAEASESKFQQAQDEVEEELYYWPAVCWWDSLGLNTPLSLVVLYDTIIQHGEGMDPDGFPAIVLRTNDTVGGAPADGVDEEEWIRGFLQTRRDTLASSCDPDSRDEWRSSTPRIAGLRGLLDDGNVDFSGPIDFDQPPYEPVTIP